MTETQPHGTTQIDRTSWLESSHVGETAVYKGPNVQTSAAWGDSVKRMWQEFNFSLDQFKHKRILDIGAGSKLRTRCFQGAYLCALEPFANHFMSKIDWCDLGEADEIWNQPAEKLRYDAHASFDFITSINVLNRYDGLHQIVSNISFYLKDGGTAFLSFDEHGQPEEKHTPLLAKEACDMVFKGCGLEIQKFQYSSPYDNGKATRALSYWLVKNHLSTALHDREQEIITVGNLSPWLTSIYLGNGVWTEHGVNMTKTSWYLDTIEGLLGGYEGKRILDIGSNTGYVALEANLRGAEVVSIEPHRINRMRCQLVYDRRSNGRITLLDQKMEDLSLEKNGHFDAIFFLGTIYHTEIPWEVLRNLSQMSKLIMVESRLAPNHKINDRVGRYRFHKYIETGDDRFPLHRVETGFIRQPTRKTLHHMLQDVGYNHVMQMMPSGGLTTKYHKEQCVAFVGVQMPKKSLSCEQNFDGSDLYCANDSTGNITPQVVKEEVDEFFDNVSEALGAYEKNRQLLLIFLVEEMARLASQLKI